MIGIKAVRGVPDVNTLEGIVRGDDAAFLGACRGGDETRCRWMRKPKCRQWLALLQRVAFSAGKEEGRQAELAEMVEIVGLALEGDGYATFFGQEVHPTLNE